MVVEIDWAAARERERNRVMAACAEYLRARGIPCGVWKVPPPSEIESAQAAFDAELERIIEDMMIEVPRIAEENR